MNVVCMGIIAAIVAPVAARADAAPCRSPQPPVVDISVREAPIVVQSDLTLADLGAMSAGLAQPPAHEALGFYTGTVGYTLAYVGQVPGPRTAGGTSCPRLEVKAALVAVERRIAIGADLSNNPCRFRAAAEHYGHHAEAASQALHRAAGDLSKALETEIDRASRSNPGPPTAEDSVSAQGVRKALDQTVEKLTASLAAVQAAVDTPSEIRKLATACGDT